MSFYLGCAVWAYRGWVGDFYPQGTPSSEFFARYMERLSAVEGNSTFYAIPSREQILAWAAEMPPEFKICPKVYKGYTHEGMLCDRLSQLHDFRAHMQGFGPNLGPVMLQLPPSYGPAAFDDLARLIEAWPVKQVPLAVELRHKAWWLDRPAQALRDLLQHHRVGKVLLDVRPVYEAADDPQLYSERRKPEVPLSVELTAGFTIVRYIGHPDPPQNDPYLDQWAARIATWLKEGVTVYFFAHCPVEERSPMYARAMYDRLVALDAPLPRLPWLDVVEPPKQLGLF